ncbi:MAG TPA: SRPBCC domain-containing protein [Polyangiaceae bacterium]|nr:SRPBCC domain-containing protein [Polyangiaceae bacterium]
MQRENLVAEVSTNVEAPVSAVWDALTDPKKIKRYMFGTTVNSSFEVGDPITWKGEFKGKSYEDKGTILRLEPRHLLAYSHFSPLSGQRDAPENYHTVVIELAEQGGGTHVTLRQDNNGTEETRQHSEQNWRAVLAGLKKEVE